MIIPPGKLTSLRDDILRVFRARESKENGWFSQRRRAVGREVLQLFVDGVTDDALHTVLAKVEEPSSKMSPFDLGDEILGLRSTLDAMVDALELERHRDAYHHAIGAQKRANIRVSLAYFSTDDLWETALTLVKREEAQRDRREAEEAATRDRNAAILAAGEPLMLLAIRGASPAAAEIASALEPLGVSVAEFEAERVTVAELFGRLADAASMKHRGPTADAGYRLYPIVQAQISKAKPRFVAAAALEREAEIKAFELDKRQTRAA